MESFPCVYGNGDRMTVEVYGKVVEIIVQEDGESTMVNLSRDDVSLLIETLRAFIKE